jgi:RsiW-degrading membrane proteinase PrsW (M82 family)
MSTSNAAPIVHTQNRSWIWTGALLTLVGFLGHFFAARAIGGYAIAYRDHIFGFFLILVVTGAIIAVLGRFFWRGRHDITILVIGVVQALFGIVIYLNRFNIA